METRKKIIRALLAYSYPWICVAAEIAVGRPKPLNCDLHRYLQSHLLSCPSLLSQYNGIRTLAYWKKLGSLVLKRLLLIVLILDRQAMSRIPEICPSLFRRNRPTELSSSTSVLQETVGVLLRQKNVLRTLHLYGYHVFYSSLPVYDIDFTASNLAVDMRDGLRLCCLAERISPTAGDVLRKISLSSTRRIDRMYNVKIALSAFVSIGIDTSNTPKVDGSIDAPLSPADIVDGDKEATLCLLWRIVLQKYVRTLLEEVHLDVELEYLENLMKGKNRVYHSFSSEAPHGGGRHCFYSHVDEQRDGHHKEMQEEASTSGDDALLRDAGPVRSHVRFVLKWMHLVGRLYDPCNFGRAGFGSELSNGALLCVLAHHYLGSVRLPLHRIVTRGGAETEDAAINFRLLKESISAAGIPWDDISCGLDIKDCCAGVFRQLDKRAAFLFVSQLCHHLLKLNRENQAAMTIQLCWKRSRSQQKERERGVARAHLQQWIKAAIAIQRAVRFRIFNRNISNWAHERRRQVGAAFIIQNMWKTYCARRRFVGLRRSAVSVQAAWKAHCGRDVFKRQIDSVRIVVASWKMYRLRKSFVGMRNASIAIQASWREHEGRKRYLGLTLATTVIQSSWRGYLARRSYELALIVRQISAAALERRNDIILSRQERIEQRHKDAAATKIQTFMRGVLARRQLSILREWREKQKIASTMATKLEMQKLAKTLQTYAMRMMAARRIQASWRSYRLRKFARALISKREEILALKKEQQTLAARVIASWTRTYVARRKFLRCRESARMIQKWWRGIYAVRTSSAIVIQRSFRRFLSMKNECAREKAAVVIQTVWRGVAIRRNRNDPDAFTAACIRARLDKARYEAYLNPHKSLGFQMDAIFKTLQQRHNNIQLLREDSIRKLLFCLEHSRSCRDSLIENVEALETILKMCVLAVRDRHNCENLKLIVRCLNCLCESPRHRNPLLRLMMETGGLQRFVELLAQQRERTNVYFTCISFLEVLVKEQPEASALGQCPEIVSCLRGVGRLLGHKKDSAAKYLTRLENQKGSDASARQATRALITVDAQLGALARIFEAIGCSFPVDYTPCNIPKAHGTHSKNMIVREVLKEMTNRPLSAE